jgi:hypothetical protein
LQRGGLRLCNLLVEFSFRKFDRGKVQQRPGFGVLRVGSEHLLDQLLTGSIVMEAKEAARFRELGFD